MSNQIKRVIFFSLFLLFTLFQLVKSSADDLDPHYKFSGVKPPSSPYKNTWGAYQTDLYSGSFSYQYKIEVPPGTNGLSPQISIGYNTHAAKGKAGWVGSGWEIPLSYIQRNIEYTRKDTANDTFELYLEGGKHDLVYVSAEDRYHTKVETYMRVVKKTGAANDTETGIYWTVTEKNGTEYRFGYNPDSATRVKATDSSFTPYTWRWSLDRIKDSNGNCIFFTYAENPTPNDIGTVYLSKIEYNNERKRLIEFILEDTDKPDMYLTIDQGSETREARRLKEIRISVNGQLARKYALSYSVNELRSKSLLTSITQFGSDGISSLPPVKFAYKNANNSFGSETSWVTNGDRRIRRFDSDGNDTTDDTFDVNGDGLPDLVKHYGSNGLYYWEISFNNKSGFSNNKVSWEVPRDWIIRNANVYIEDDQAPDTKSCPIDINGDGFIDFLWARGGTSLQIRMNSGAGFTAVPDWGIHTEDNSAWMRNVQRPDDRAANVEQDFFDMNGDGLPDLVEKYDDNSWRIQRNTGNGFTDFGIWHVQHAYAWVEDFTRDAQLQVGHFDMNGDGLPDLVNPKGPDSSGISEWQIYLNTGSNFISIENWRASTFSDLIVEVDSTGNVKRDLIDINGDGLPDIVDPVYGSGNWNVSLNTGKGFTEKKYWPAIFTDGYVKDVTRPDDDGFVLTPRDVFDLDGDGLPDIVKKDSTDWKIYKNQSGQADLLTQITDMLGGMITVTYSASVNYANTRLPFNYWVVSSVTANNGMTGPHALSSTTGYSYAQGLYDFPSQEFRGFGQVVETRPDGSTVTHYFHQDEARKGKESRSEIKSNTNALFAATDHSWSSISADGFYVPRLNQTNEYTHDGISDGPKIIRRSFQNYDNYGNIGLELRYGDVTTDIDDSAVYNEYAYNPDLWIVDRPKHTHIINSRTGYQLREAWYYYDNSSTNGAVPSKGNLTKEEHYLNSYTKPETTYQYDSYGNRISTTDAEGNVSRTIYESTYNTFPLQSYNAKNHLTTHTFNPIDGQLLKEVDPNGWTTSHEYDVFGRKTKEIKPYDTSALPTTLIQYGIDGIAPESVKVSKRETSGQPGTLDLFQFVDGFGNLIQTRSEWISYNDVSMVTTIKDVYYDSMGRVWKQSNPYFFLGGEPIYLTPNTNINSIRYRYDSLGRPITVTNPDNTVVSRAFDHWKVTETDENGHVKSYLFDAFQRLKQVTEQNGSSSYITWYIFNPIGELNRIVDHLGHETKLEYDMMGRKTRMVDPDLGTWTYSYDKVGNLTTQVDARGISTTFEYDELNRKRKIYYTNNDPVYFLYDFGTTGVLTIVYESSGGALYFYDNRYRKIRELKGIDGQEWNTYWSYDALDRVVSQTYPDGQVVTFNYTTEGPLYSIPGIIDEIQYNVAGQMTLKKYVNGHSTSYQYNDANFRLTSLVTPSVQDLHYTSDNVGNIKSIDDQWSDVIKTFSYDDLDRLTQGGDSGYQRSYQYNAVGNMLSESRNGTTVGYQYSSVHPHAVSSVTLPAPLVGSLALNNGDYYTTSRSVTLNNISIGNPTSYMASENPYFTGANWQIYSTSPSFTLSTGVGEKTVFFKVKNADGESSVKTDYITVSPCPNSADTDSDDDGISDNDEDKNSNGIVDVGETDPCNPDTDGDGIQDGTELGITQAIPDPDGTVGPLLGTNTTKFQPDLDPATKTDPLNADTDGDGIKDGDEDKNHNGKVDDGETDPAVRNTNTSSPLFFPVKGKDGKTAIIYVE